MVGPPVCFDQPGKSVAKLIEVGIQNFNQLTFENLGLEDVRTASCTCKVIYLS